MHDLIGLDRVRRRVGRKITARLHIGALDVLMCKAGYGPKIVDGYNSLKESGSVEDDFLTTSLPKMKKV